MKGPRNHTNSLLEPQEVTKTDHSCLSLEKHLLLPQLAANQAGEVRDGCKNPDCCEELEKTVRAYMITVVLFGCITWGIRYCRYFGIFGPEYW